jgi:hypothetical protein
MPASGRKKRLTYCSGASALCVFLLPFLTPPINQLFAETNWGEHGNWFSDTGGFHRKTIAHR